MEFVAFVIVKFFFRGFCFCLYNRGGWWGWGVILFVGGEFFFGGEIGNIFVISKMFFF